MTQSQREALLDLLVFAIFTDSHLSLREDAALLAAFDSLGWEAIKPREIFICNSMNRARKAADSDASGAAYIVASASAFTDAESQKSAIDLLQRVFASDGVVPSEAAFLARLQSNFPK